MRYANSTFSARIPYPSGHPEYKVHNTCKYTYCIIAKEPLCISITFEHMSLHILWHKILHFTYKSVCMGYKDAPFSFIALVQYSDFIRTPHCMRSTCSITIACP